MILACDLEAEVLLTLCGVASCLLPRTQDFRIKAVVRPKQEHYKKHYDSFPI